MSIVFADNTVQKVANKKADLAAKIAGDLAAATVHLFTNNIVPTPQSVVGDFVEATFTGYAAVAVAGWTAVAEYLDGSVSSSGTAVIPFVGPGDATGETIYGYFVLSAGGGTPLLYAALFDTPFPLATPADVMDLVPTYKVA